MTEPAPAIVRDVADYPTADAARASLPDLYASYPYVGELLQPGDGPNCWMYTFSVMSIEQFLEAGWTTR